MDLKEAVEWLEEIKDAFQYKDIECAININGYKSCEEAIETVLNELDKKDKENAILRQGLEENTQEIDKKDKIINEIAEMLVKDHEWFYSEFDNYTKQDFIDYFTKKVSE